MTELFKKLDPDAYRGGKMLLTDGTANQDFDTAKVEMGYYDMADNTWKDRTGTALTFIPYYYFPFPLVLA